MNCLLLWKVHPYYKIDGNTSEISRTSSSKLCSHGPGQAVNYDVILLFGTPQIVTCPSTCSFSLVTLVHQSQAYFLAQCYERDERNNRQISFFVLPSFCRVMYVKNVGLGMRIVLIVLLHVCVHIAYSCWSAWVHKCCSLAVLIATVTLPSVLACM